MDQQNTKRSKASNSKTEFSKEINLPKGGGSIQGMGGSFHLSEFSGTAGMSMPISTTPCRGMEPGLVLSYGSSQGNGLWGLGWDLSLPSISRKTNRGIPRYQNTDSFSFNSEDLVPANESSRQALVDGIPYTVRRYYDRDEGDFSLIEYWHPEECNEHRDSFWKVTSADHVISIFGRSSEAKISDPHNPDHVFSWLLEETYDLGGNHQLFFYKRENENGVDENALYEQNRAVTANLYIERIRYGNKKPIQGSIVLSESPFLDDSSQWSFEVVFNYGEYDINPGNNRPYTPVQEWDCRTDPFSTYYAGFERRTYRLCENILMFHRFEEMGENPVLIHTTEFQYQPNAAKITELVSASVTGYQYDLKYDVYNTATLPASEFSYIPFSPKETYDWIPLTSDQKESLPGFNRSPNYNVVDLYGEGIPGILYSDGATTYYRSRHIEFPVPDINYKFLPQPIPSSIQGNTLLKEDSAISYSPWQQLESFPVERQLGEAQLTDMNSDGHVDILLNQADLKGYWEVGSDRIWQPFQSFENYPSTAQEQNQTWVDLTGNGLSDLVQFTQQTISLYPSLAGSRWGSPIVRTRPSDMPLSLNSTDREVVRFIDIAGSGNPQLVRVRPGEVTYWPSLGYCRFSKSIRMKNAPRFSENFRVERLFFADLDGSGTTDLIYIESEKAFIYLNRNGNEFSEPIELALPTLFSSLDQIHFADVKGRGNSCLILSEHNGGSQSQFWCYDFCQGQKPYLLQKIDSNMGSSTELTYSSSVDSYLQDKQDGLPWITSLPFPVQVVTKVINTDEISGSRYESYYSYHHGYYDGTEREFRGFGRVDRQDAEYSTSLDPLHQAPHFVAPSLTRTWYHTGTYQKDVQLSRQYAHEFYHGDSQAFKFPDSLIEWEDFTPDSHTRYEAFSALAGTVLRSEVYGLDNKKESECPYSVSESNSCVRVIQPKGENQHAVFLVHNRETLDYNYERNPQDPQIDHSFTLKVNDFGHTLLSASVAYGRRDIEGALPEQQSIRGLCETQAYAAPEKKPRYYRLGVPLENKAYHLTNIEPPPKQSFQFEDLREAIEKSLATVSDTAPSSDSAKLLGWGKVCYAEVVGKGKDAETVVLPFGKIPLVPKPLLVGQQWTAEFSQKEVTDALGNVLKGNKLKEKLQAGYYHLDEENQYWWAPSALPQYHDSNCFYTIKALKDQAGGLTIYDYDPYLLVLLKVTDALGYTTEAQDIDYQTLHPGILIDVNGNMSQVRFDPLGQVIYTSHYGHEEGKPRGYASINKAPNLNPPDLETLIHNPKDFLGEMESYFYYDAFAWQRRRQPLVSVSVVAQNYPGEKEYPPQISLSYNDGFGRSLQVKAKTDPGEAFLFDSETNKVTEGYADDRWLSSSRTVYNNKGEPIKQYEPYFIDTPNFVSNPILDTFGVTDTHYYDPLGRSFMVLTAKGFLEKNEWTAWESTSSDANDTILEAPYYIANILYPDKNLPFRNKDITPAEIENLKYIAKYFYDTPERSIEDNMGNVIITESMRKSEDEPDGVLLQSVATYDIAGNVLTSSDPRLQEIGRNNFITTYGMNGAAFKVVSADAGTVWSFSNIFGNPLFSHDSRGVEITPTYDILQRVTQVHVFKEKRSKKDPLVLDQVVERFFYGESTTEFKERNLCRQPYKHYDQAGVSVVHWATMAGAPLCSEQRFRIDYKEEADWGAVNDKTLQDLLGPAYPQKATYDALGRVIKEIDPGGNITQPQYQPQSGLLNQVAVTASDDEKTINYIQGIEYNARGQRTYLTLGNQTKTEYFFDPKTFETTKITNASILLGNDQKLIQDLRYIYDPVGNIIQKEDQIPEAIYHGNQIISPIGTYRYNSLYQLIAATGREKKKRSCSSRAEDPFASFNPHVNDDQALVNYLERYTYDNGGNLTITQHGVLNGSPHCWTREIIMDPHSNRGISATIRGKSLPPPKPNQVSDYFDKHGNQIQMQQVNPLVWNYRNNLQKVVTVERADGSHDAEYYVYNSGGKRVRKVNEQYGNGGKRLFRKEVLYIGNLEIRQTFKEDVGEKEQLDKESHSLRIADVATRHYWKGKHPKGLKNPTVFYQLSDHLGSNTIQVTDQGDIVSYEEYSPYGETTLFIGSGTASDLKHYRYSNQERDSVTGFYYYGMRYYASWLGRWFCPDPAGTIDGPNLYAFVGGNPVTMQDIGGMAPPKGDKSKKPLYPKSREAARRRREESQRKRKKPTDYTRKIRRQKNLSSKRKETSTEKLAPPHSNITNVTPEKYRVEYTWFKDTSKYLKNYVADRKKENSRDNKNYGLATIKFKNEGANIEHTFMFNEKTPMIFKSGWKETRENEENINTYFQGTDEEIRTGVVDFLEESIGYNAQAEELHFLSHTEESILLHLNEFEFFLTNVDEERLNNKPVTVLVTQTRDACMKNCHHIFEALVSRYPHITVKSLGFMSHARTLDDGNTWIESTSPWRKKNVSMIRKYSNTNGTIGGPVTVRQKSLTQKQTRIDGRKTDWGPLKGYGH